MCVHIILLVVGAETLGLFTAPIDRPTLCEHDGDCAPPNVCDRSSGSCRRFADEDSRHGTSACDELRGLVSVRISDGDGWVCASYVNGVYGDGARLKGLCDPGDYRAFYSGRTQCSCEPPTVVKTINGTAACVVNPRLYESGN